MNKDSNLQLKLADHHSPQSRISVRFFSIVKQIFIKENQFGAGSDINYQCFSPKFQLQHQCVMTSWYFLQAHEGICDPSSCIDPFAYVDSTSPTMTSLIRAKFVLMLNLLLQWSFSSALMTAFENWPLWFCKKSSSSLFCVLFNFFLNFGRFLEVAFFPVLLRPAPKVRPNSFETREDPRLKSI